MTIYVVVTDHLAVLSVAEVVGSDECSYQNAHHNAVQDIIECFEEFAENDPELCSHCDNAITKYENLQFLINKGIALIDGPECEELSNEYGFKISIVSK